MSIQNSNARRLEIQIGHPLLRSFRSQVLYDAIFVMMDDSMKEDSKRGLIKNDWLKCREIQSEPWKTYQSLEKLKKVIIVTKGFNLVGEITECDIPNGMIVLSKYCPDWVDIKININEIEEVFTIDTVQRDWEQNNQLNKS